MTSKDLSIFNSLRPFSIGFDDMFDQFENMLGNGGLSMQSNYPPYNIRRTGQPRKAYCLVTVPVADLR
jgi:molecular chaperone IbpA